MSAFARRARWLAVILSGAWVLLFFGYLGWKPGFAYNAQRYFEILLLGLLLCAGLWLPVKFSLGRAWRRWTLILLAVMALVIVQASNAWLAVREGLQYLVLWAAILVVAKARYHAGSASFDRAAYLGVVLFTFGICLMVLEGLALSLSIGQLDSRVIFAAFVNIRVFAELLFLVLLLLPAAAQSGRGVAWSRFVTFTAWLGWGLLLFSGTRSAVIALPFALLLLGLFVGRPAIAWFKRLAGQFLGGVVVYLCLRVASTSFLGLPVWGGSGSMSFARASSSGRIQLWGDAWSYFLEHPWWGNGPGMFACRTTELVATPHNLVFQLLSEWGGIMTLLCLGLALGLFSALVRFFRADGAALTPLHFGLFATLAATVTASMMEGMIIGPLQQMLIVLVFGWALSVFVGEKFTAMVGQRSGLPKLLHSTALLTFMLVAVSGIRQDLDLQRELLVSPEGVINLSYGPRFWADGHDHCTDWHQRYEQR